jgi:peptide/nickel transport system substrate-binding protein
MAKNNNEFLGMSEIAPNEAIRRYNLDAPTVRTLISNDEHDISSNWLPTDVKAAFADAGGKLL